MSDLFLTGCAGWSIPSSYADRFPTSGSHLERYAARLNAVEINSSFYRPHRVQTYRKWAAAVPDSFRFAVKVPKLVTHENRLKNSVSALESFLGEVAGLGHKLGPLLVQLPPSLVFDRAVADTFFQTMRERFTGQIVCEPRHASWFAANANELLARYEVARVTADPPPIPGATDQGGWGGLGYYRLHGSPIIYHSAYSTEYLARLAKDIQWHFEQSVPIWCIFDNTAEGAATGNALQLGEFLGALRTSRNSSTI